jgi:hypothetical protein
MLYLKEAPEVFARIYVAAYTDAKSSLQFSPTGMNTYTVRVTYAGKPEIVSMLQEGVLHHWGIRGRETRTNSRGEAPLLYFGHAANDLLKILIPHMLVKRDRAAWLIETWDNRLVPGTKSVNHDYLSQRSREYQEGV